MNEYTINYGKPKKMVFELSEDGTYYNAKFYHGFMDSDGKIYEGWIELKVDAPALNNAFKVRKVEDDDKIFEIIVADEEQVNGSFKYR